MNPRERERRLMVWNSTERLLFSPSGRDNQAKWCVCFLRSLARYWAIDEFVRTGPHWPKGEFSLPIPGFSLSYDLSGWTDASPRASIWMKFQEKSLAAYDIDHRYDAKEKLCPMLPGGLLGRYLNTATREAELMADIQWVLDRYLIHPCAHMHLWPEFLLALGAGAHLSTEVLHEIRFGAGIINPFTALFQFRINLLLGESIADVKERKAAERDRLAGLIHSAILQNAMAIAPGSLFGLSRA